MATTRPSTVTRLLDAMRAGDREAVDALFPVVYEALRRVAHRQRRHWQGDFTLNTTALVHEAYLKLVDPARAEWTSRAHFMSVAAKAMRHLLVDYARHRGAAKRGGGVRKLSLEEMLVANTGELALSDERAEALVALDEALRRLEAISPRQGRVVECRFFAEMTIEETAAALDVSSATVKRDLAMAQAWLYNDLKKHL